MLAPEHCNTSTVAWHCSKEVYRPYTARMAGQKMLGLQRNVAPGTVAWDCRREVYRPYTALMAGQKSLQAVYGP